MTTVRLRNLLLASCLIAVFLPVASAHYSHSPCGSSATVATSTLAHLDRWAGACIGAAVSSPRVACTTNLHFDAAGVHVFALYSTGCQTGVVVERPPALP